MSKFREKPEKPKEVEATQWFKNGDHPEDQCEMIRPDPESETQFEPFLSEGKVVRHYRRPDVDGRTCCVYCGKKFHDHGWIDRRRNGHDICPGDYIVVDAAGYYAITREVFERDFEPVEG